MIEENNFFVCFKIESANFMVKILLFIDLCIVSQNKK